VYHLKIYFNMTTTTDREIMSGQIKDYAINLMKDKVPLWGFVTFTEILDDSYFKFNYCLPNHTPFLLTMGALASPFDLWTWIVLLLSFILLLFVRLQSKNSMGGIEKVLSTIGLLLEQSQHTLNAKGVLVFISFLILTSIYKTRVTSDLLVPAPVQPAKNLSSLVQKGYKMVYDYQNTQIIDKLRSHPNLKAYNFVLFNGVTEDLKKVIWLESMVNDVAKTFILMSERIFLNMTCFSKESSVGKDWRSWSFYHPWYNRMNAFTKAFLEAGMFELFWKVQRNGYRLPTRSESGNRNTKSFIKFEEAQPIFLICLLSLTGTIAVFAIENKKILCLTCQLVLAFIKFSLQLKKCETGESSASAAKEQSISSTIVESLEENSVC